MHATSLLSRSALALGLFATLALSQEQTQTEKPLQPVTYVAEWQIKRGMENAYLELVNELYAPAFETLMAGEDPAILGWGVSERVLHDPEEPTHSMWYTMPDMAAMDRVNAALAATDEVDTQVVNASASTVPQPTILGQKIEAIADTSTHRDLLYRHTVFARSETLPARDVLPNTWIFRAKALPGKAEAYKQLWEKYYRPFFDQWIADGTLMAYGLALPAVRTTNDFTHTTWLQFPDYASYQKAYDVFMEHQASLGPDELSRREGEFLAATDPEAALGTVLQSRVFHSARTR